MNQNFQPAIKIPNYTTRFAVHNSTVVKFNKILLNDQYDILEVNFGMKCLNILKVVFIRAQRICMSSETIPQGRSQVMFSFRLNL